VGREKENILLEVSHPSRFSPSDKNRVRMVISSGLRGGRGILISELVSKIIWKK
jgi:hypothetical protein